MQGAMMTNVVKARAILGTALILLLVVALPDVVRAGGVQRPNTNGARAVGLSGAYTAVADDALSIYYNPAGLARIKTADIVLSAELVFMIREYTPIGRDPEKAAVGPTPLPAAFGGARLLVGKNSFLAVGFGVYSSFGGAVKYDKEKVTEGVLESQIVLFEFAPTIAYQVSDRIFIGLSIRMGLGSFTVLKGCNELTSCRHEDPDDKDWVHETKVGPMVAMGVGYSLGIQVLPFDWLTIGVTYRSNLDIKFEKKDAVQSASTFDASVKMPYPQSVLVGLAFKLSKNVVLATQFDWTDNSRMREIFVDIPGWIYGRASIATDLMMKDSIAVHLGTEIKVSKMLTLRGGMTYDGQAIPNKYRDRSLADAHKLLWDVGATLRFGRWRLEMAAELLMGDVSQGFKSVVFPNGEGYAAPGKHAPGGVFSFHLGGGVAW